MSDQIQVQAPENVSEPEFDSAPSDTDLLDWLQLRVAAAATNLRIREEMAATWRSGTNAEWVAAGALHPTTAGLKQSKSARMKQADMHERIAKKLRRDLAMLRAAQKRLVQAMTAPQGAAP